ncbi:carbon-nitrogen hydrolase family protein [Robiginitalea sp. IMCC43444]|uniref:carbon-nitrogen hydrolase family protein n=1 Tax=Robiginitalea sp. IMCC43444 TaxID=3459121 RepID=UPI004042D63B
MKIGVAQIETSKGNIQKNIEIHKTWIELAIMEKADLIVFPELSLTGYEPELAAKLAIDLNDPRLDDFQKLSDLNNITIGLGIPARSDSGILISMAIFQTGQDRKKYSKQRLHPDELPYFVEAEGQLILTVKNINVAPAICYESLQKEHSENAIKLGAAIYLASVAKSQNGIEKAFAHYPQIAKKYSVPVIMANHIGLCDNLLCAGQSAVWNEKGEISGKLEKDKEGLLLYNTETAQVILKGKTTAKDGRKN